MRPARRMLGRDGVVLDEVGECEVELVPVCELERAAHQLVAPRSLAVPPQPDHHRHEVALGVEVKRIEVCEALQRTRRGRKLACLQMKSRPALAIPALPGRGASRARGSPNRHTAPQ